MGWHPAAASPATGPISRSTRPSGRWRNHSPRLLAPAVSNRSSSPAAAFATTSPNTCRRYRDTGPKRSALRLSALPGSVTSPTAAAASSRTASSRGTSRSTDPARHADFREHDEQARRVRSLRPAPAIFAVFTENYQPLKCLCRRNPGESAARRPKEQRDNSEGTASGGPQTNDNATSNRDGAEIG